ncbi:FAD-dependent monooxygenase [Streptomyces coeruleorubidus]|uniref:FAD-dependent monooxygenase n=1 Tax=Streptomyces coeruleorubidus TaxID=116188 RepID=UPI0033A581C6
MEKTDVVVVGSGPTGLLLAAELALAGVDVWAVAILGRGTRRWCSYWRPRAPARPPPSARRQRACPTRWRGCRPPRPTPVRDACSPTSKRSWHGTHPPRTRWRPVRCARASSTRNPPGFSPSPCGDTRWCWCSTTWNAWGCREKSGRRSAPSCTIFRERCARSWSAGATSRRRCTGGSTPPRWPHCARKTSPSPSRRRPRPCG